MPLSKIFLMGRSYIFYINKYVFDELSFPLKTYQRFLRRGSGRCFLQKHLPEKTKKG